MRNRYLGQYKAQRVLSYIAMILAGIAFVRGEGFENLHLLGVSLGIGGGIGIISEIRPAASHKRP